MTEEIKQIPRRCVGCQMECLHKIEFLTGLPEEKQLEVIRHSRREQTPKDGFLFEEGDKVDGIYLLHGGQVKLCTYQVDGREQIVSIFSAGETIWEGILMENSRYPYHGICLGDVDYCKIRRKDLEEVMKDPTIGLRIIGMLSKKLHDANERNLLLSLTDPKARLAGLLLFNSRSRGTDVVTMRLEDMAGSIHLRPETISRKIHELERQGILQKEGQSTIRIVDRERLKECYQS